MARATNPGETRAASSAADGKGVAQAPPPEKGDGSLFHGEKENRPLFPVGRLVGKPTPRIDGREVVTGRAVYTHDVRLPGCLAGTILRSPHAAAKVVSIDLSAARALPGVRAAIAIAKDRVFFVGDDVAAVAADDEATAERALEKIAVVYEPLPAAASWEKAREPGAPAVLAGGEPNVKAIGGSSRGDVEKGFAAADVVLERTYRTATEVHHPAETHASVAAWDGDHLTVYDSTQAVHDVRDALAEALGVPQSSVTVIKQYMGGGFGSKLDLGPYTVAAARLAREAGRPVRIALSRRENAYCVGHRPPTVQTIKGGARRDGTLTALSLDARTSGGTAQGDEVGEPMADVYACPDVRIRETTVFANMGPQRAMRAPGHVPGTFALEGFIDEMAAELGMDPLELRRRNYSTRNRGGTGLPYSTKGLDRCYDIGARTIGWERRNPSPGAVGGRFRRGLGMASQIWWGTGVPGTLADLTLYPDGSVEIVSGTQDLGTGTRTWMAAIVAEALGIDPAAVTVRIGNSDYPWAILSGGSLTAPSVGPAVRDASLRAMERLVALAAGLLKTAPEDIAAEPGRFVRASDPSQAVATADVFRRLGRERVFHGERDEYPEDRFAFNTFGAHFSEVEVDAATGRVRVVKHVAVHDSGRILNRLTAESQVIGGVVQGIGAALLEERVLDPAIGRPVDLNLRDYKVPTAGEAPEIVPIFLDAPDDRLNNLGVKGLGEPPRIPASAAIANAVFNAIGVPLREIPMTPDRVLAALRGREAAR